jgi:hypothetical protein
MNADKMKRQIQEFFLIRVFARAIPGARPRLRSGQRRYAPLSNFCSRQKLSALICGYKLITGAGEQ